jgi:tubulin polyglutamylase TTLL5
LKQEGHDVAAAWARIDDVIIKSILSIENTVFSAMEMTVPYRTNCFEVLGFDILLDNNLRPWLLEINLSPSLNTDSPLDLKIKGSMIADLFTMIGVIPPDQQFGVDKSYLLNQNKMSAKEMKN